MKNRNLLLSLILLLAFSPLPGVRAGGEMQKLYVPMIVKTTGGLITGTVTFQGVPAAGMPVYLLKKADLLGPYEQKLFTDAQGRYTFYDPTASLAGETYVVMYVNNDEYMQLPLLRYYKSPDIPYRPGESYTLNPFEISNVWLDQPIEGETLDFPITFRWYPRNISTDHYVFWLAEFDQAVNPTDPIATFFSPDLGAANSFTLQSLPPGFSAHPYCTWGIYIYATDGGIGTSYEVRAVHPQSPAP